MGTTASGNEPHGSEATCAVELRPSSTLKTLSPKWPGMRTRWIIPPTSKGRRSTFALAEWELEKAIWTDLHHHDEVNVVVEGELKVTVGNETVIARSGDMVRVAAGQLGRYSAPSYARMIGIYGPSSGKPDECFAYEQL